MKPIGILAVLAAVLAVPPTLQTRVERLENLQQATVEKLVVTIRLVEAQEAELALLRDCVPECFPPQEWDGAPLPVPPMEEYDGEKELIDP